MSLCDALCRKFRQVSYSSLIFVRSLSTWTSRAWEYRRNRSSLDKLRNFLPLLYSASLRKYLAKSYLNFLYSSKWWIRSICSHHRFALSFRGTVRYFGLQVTFLSWKHQQIMQFAGAPTPIMYVSFLALSLAFTIGTVSYFDIAYFRRVTNFSQYITLNKIKLI